jgi:hypothetical protein
MWREGVEVEGTGSYQWADGLPFNVTQEWPYVIPFDRRLWPEHRDGKRAGVAHATAKKKIQTTESFDVT